MNKIFCSVGILTYNSGKNLRRALESVKDFSDIIISDGGSTDDTLEIAREFGCKIIEQYTKRHPGPDKHHPIEDFSRERNLMISAAKEDWYLWIDSDEYVSEKLREEISLVCKESTPSNWAYEIPIAIQSPDGLRTYKRPVKVYQIRFFSLKIGGRFERAMHERFVFSRTEYSVGRLSGVWYVPLSKPDFDSYSRAVKYRIDVMYKELLKGTTHEFWRYGLYLPIKRTGGVIFRLIQAKIKYGRESMPLFYYRNQLYSQWVTFCVVLRLYRKKST